MRSLLLCVHSTVLDPLKGIAAEVALYHPVHLILLPNSETVAVPSYGSTRGVNLYQSERSNTSHLRSCNNQVFRVLQEMEQIHRAMAVHRSTVPLKSKKKRRK